MQVGRGLLSAIARMLANAIHPVYGYLQGLSLQVTASTATGAILERHAAGYKLARKQPAVTIGTVTATGEPGLVIPLGSPLQNYRGWTYQTDASATVGGDGTVEIAITALEAGSAGNDHTGRLSWVSPQAGRNPEVDVVTLGGGADLESDDALRVRVIDRKANPPHGGRAADYRLWATSVPAIDAAWVFTQYVDDTIRVYVRADGDDEPGETASAASIALAEAAIETERPVNAVYEVVSASHEAVDFELTVGPDSAEVRAAVEAELGDLFWREAEPEGTVLLTHIREAISRATGETDHTLTTPSANVTAAAGNILVLGTVTWS